MDLNEANKALVSAFWADRENSGSEAMSACFAAVMSPEVAWHGFAPILSLSGPNAIADEFWMPFAESFQDLTRETHIFFGGESNGRADGDISRDGRHWVTGTGLFHGTFAKDYLTIPATGDKVSIRWGEFCCVAGGQITEIYFMIDMVDLMQQAGHSVLPPARGADGMYPAPAAGDGVLDGSVDPNQSALTLAHIRRFIYDGLNAFDEDDLSSMGMADWFHENARWYGPGGIGACLSFKEFEDLHQAPWLVAFPDREVQDLDAIIAEGAYSAAPGYAGVLATHTGPYLDQPATGNQIQFNGLDWWKQVDGKYVENWVFVDMVHLFDQFGVNLFDRLS